MNLIRLLVLQINLCIAFCIPYEFVSDFYYKHELSNVLFVCKNCKTKSIEKFYKNYQTASIELDKKLSIIECEVEFDVGCSKCCLTFIKPIWVGNTLASFMSDRLTWTIALIFHEPVSNILKTQVLVISSQLGVTAWCKQAHFKSTISTSPKLLCLT